MTRQQWTDAPQKRWLDARLAAFVDAQQKKTTATAFFPEVHREWHEAFPTPPPTDDEIRKVGGDVEAATAAKRKYWERVGHTRYNSFCE